MRSRIIMYHVLVNGSMPSNGIDTILASSTILVNSKLFASFLALIKVASASILALDRAALVSIRGDDGAPGQLFCPILVGHAQRFTFGATARGFFIIGPPYLVAWLWPGVVAWRARGGEAEAGRERGDEATTRGVLWA
jgi:hypothetical protein